MRIWSKVSGLAIGLAKLVSSFIFFFLHSPPAWREGLGEGIGYSAAMAVG